MTNPLADLLGPAPDPNAPLLTRLQGFSPAPTEANNMQTGLVVQVWGAPKRGKTHFAMTAPAPIVVFDLDMGLRGVTHKFPDKEIYARAYPIRPDQVDDIDEQARILDTIERDILRARDLVSPLGGTIVIDTESQLWQLASLVKLSEERTQGERAKLAASSGKTVRPMQFDWRRANSYMSALLRTIISDTRVNVVFISRASEQYQDGNPTGRIEPQCWKETPYIVDTVVQIRDCSAPGREHEPAGFIQHCRSNREIQGLEVPNLKFDQLKKLVLSPPDDQPGEKGTTP